MEVDLPISARSSRPLLQLFSIIRDNANDNSTLCCHLYKKLKHEFDDEDKPNQTKLLVYFYSKDNYIQYLAHVINLICKIILKELKASTHKEAKVILNAIANITIAQTAIIKLCLFIIWILNNTQRID
jgi:hypothetical protein